MKTQFRTSRKSTVRIFGLLAALMVGTLVSNPLNAQTSKIATTEVAQQGRTIKGIITNEEGPLESASVVLKGTNIGTNTNTKGEFTFPKLLKTDDVLLVSYLGYATQELKIKENEDIVKLQLTEELVEFVGALNTDAPYKSNRSKD